MDDVLAVLVSEDQVRPQIGETALFRRSAFVRIRAAQDLSALSWDELQRRLRAFEMLTLTIDGQAYDVTKLRRIDGGRPWHRRLAFVTSDGVRAEPVRFVHLPFALYRWYRLLRQPSR
jgi:hypothetical protein